MTPFTNEQAVTFSNISTGLKCGNFFFNDWSNPTTMFLQEFVPVLMLVKKDRLKDILFHALILPELWPN